MSIHICDHCGCVLEPGQEYHFHDGIYCETCIDELTTICDHCGKRIFRDDDEGNAHMTLCSRCFRDYYTTCERCGRLIRNENAYYEDDEDDIPYCNDCFQKHTHIHGYYYKPEPIFYGDDSRFFGVELEVDDGGESFANAKAVLEVANETGDHIYIKHDGSLNEGFELVTHPMTLDFHSHSMPWQKVLAKLKELGYHSHQTATAGLHVHVNRDSLGYTYQEQEETIARILFFMEKHWNELLKFSRRTPSQLERWAARYGYKDNPQEILKTAKGGYGRYTCLNLCNENTIEFRIFRGTLKYNTLIATLQLVSQICSVAFVMSDEDMRNLSWTTFVASCQYPELIQYLKERRLYINEPVESEVDV